jgi:PAS domain S-box-containing protein
MLQSGKDIFEILSEAIPEGLLIVDDNQQIVSVNSSCLNIFNYEREELVGKKLTLLIPQRYHGNHGKNFKGFLKTAKEGKWVKGAIYTG